MTQTPHDDSEQAFLDLAVVIALGSNLPGGYPSSRELLNAALKALDDHRLRVVRASSWWRSKAWPDGSGPDFFNGVALVQTDLSPREVLNALHRVERDFGRSRSEPNAPRTLDLDLIAYGRTIVAEKGLVVPHPRYRARRFVTAPLSSIASRWSDPSTCSQPRRRFALTT